MRHLAAIALALALPLGACSTAALTPSLPPADQVAAAKAEILAEEAYNTAAEAYEQDESYLTPAQKSTAKALFAQAYTALQAARAAETLGDTATIGAKATAIGQLAAQISAALTAAKPGD